MIGLGLKVHPSSVQGYVNGEAIFKPNSSYVVQKLPAGPSQGGRLLAGLCVALVFIIVVTITRLTLRIRRKMSKNTVLSRARRVTFYREANVSDLTTLPSFLLLSLELPSCLVTCGLLSKVLLVATSPM
jgi:hypothetical protein